MRTLNILSFFLVFSLALSLFSGCKKDAESNKIIYGTLSVDIKVMHHSWAVPNIPLYLKKNSSTFPGNDTSLYELKTIADSDGKAIFNQLYPGNYYLFASGYDYYFGANVIGSMPLHLSTPTSEDDPLKITLMVSE